MEISIINTPQPTLTSEGSRASVCGGAWVLEAQSKTCALFKIVAELLLPPATCGMQELAALYEWRSERLPATDH